MGKIKIKKAAVLSATRGREYKIMKTYKIDLRGETYTVKLEKNTYANNKRLAVSLFTVPDGEPFATITVNIDFPLSGDKTTTAFVDTNNYDFMNIENFLQSNKIATPTGERGESGYCVYPEYRFDLSKF